MILMFLTIYGVGKSQCDRSNGQQSMLHSKHEQQAQSNLLFPDGQHQTGGSNCVIFEIMSININT